MSAAVAKVSYRRRTAPWPSSGYILEVIGEEPRCFVCGELAEAYCDWAVRTAEDQFDRLVPVLCRATVCYRHMREVDDNRHYCADHWNQLGPANTPQPTGVAR